MYTHRAGFSGRGVKSYAKLKRFTTLTNAEVTRRAVKAERTQFRLELRGRIERIDQQPGYPAMHNALVGLQDWLADRESKDTKET
jgi:hypothetical protein